MRSDYDEKQRRHEEFERHWSSIGQMQHFDRGKLDAMSDTELAAWQAMQDPPSPQYRLVEHIWQERLTERQIKASFKAARLAAIWGIVGTILGALLGWFLSSWRP